MKPHGATPRNLCSNSPLALRRKIASALLTRKNQTRSRPKRERAWLESCGEESMRFPTFTRTTSRTSVRQAVSRLSCCPQLTTISHQLEWSHPFNKAFFHFQQKAYDLYCMDAVQVTIAILIFANFILNAVEAQFLPESGTELDDIFRDFGT